MNRLPDIFQSDATKTCMLYTRIPILRSLENKCHEFERLMINQWRSSHHRIIEASKPVKLSEPVERVREKFARLLRDDNQRSPQHVVL